jgi:Cys-tRNA(Pro)/Cys-tRNA(Cys) deacylase
MAKSPPVSLALNKLGVPHQVFYHSHQLHSLEQAAEERGQRPEQVVRSILFRLAKDEYLIVLVAGPNQIDWKILRQYVGTNRLSMAKKNEVLPATGYPTGAVAPFGLPKPIRTLVDKSVLKEDIVSLGSGVRNVAIILKSADLMQALPDSEVGQFTSSLE